MIRRLRVVRSCGPAHERIVGSERGDGLGAVEEQLGGGEVDRNNDAAHEPVPSGDQVFRVPKQFLVRHVFWPRRQTPLRGWTANRRAYGLTLSRLPTCNGLVASAGGIY